MVEEQTDKTLIISPHLDDEVYGCSSFLREGVVVAYVTKCHPLFPEGENVAEQKVLAETVGFESIHMKPQNFPDSTNDLDRYGQMELIGELEEILRTCQPDTVLVPSPSYNQDHRAMYDASLTAMRPHDRNHFVKRVLLYEEPETWGTLRQPDPFHANYYRPLDIERKIALMRIYQSQMRGHRTPSHVRSLARVRGMQANMDFAEAFEVLRWIE